MGTDSNVSPQDPNSFSRPDECRVVDLNLKINVDFVKTSLLGYVDVSAEKVDPNACRLILDTRDLSINSVVLPDSGQTLEFNVGEPVLAFGSPLTIKLPQGISERFTCRINYATSSNSSALQWLSPQQTAGKKHPYVFSHCEAIHARSMLPCQDTPAVKTPYKSEVTVPAELCVLMSAVRQGESTGSDPSTRTYSFFQKVPIPSYLIALAAGALESRDIGPRSKVWSEKELVDKAAYEFAETEQMLSAAESLFGPYVWGQYDILVLPPSFPFGGMENPCLTFVTPTLLAGDRSLANVVAHEIAHSWTGNLVTNRNFEHFWLNEGFTVFAERKIASKMFGEQTRHFEAIGGWKDLQDCIENLGASNILTKLVVNLDGVDPDDAFSTVPYEKGHSLLFYLEQKLGGPDVFEPFLRSYIEKFQYKSLDTDTWKSFLYEYFKDKVEVLNSVNWDSWFNTPGMPPETLKFDSTLADACSQLMTRWIQAAPENLSEFSAEDLKPLSSGQIREFLAQLLLQDRLPLYKMEALQNTYNFNEMTNSEIRFRWIRLGLRAQWKSSIDLAVKFVTEQGRMKFVRPVYRDLYQWEETRQLALDTFTAHRDEMMYVTANTVCKDLKLDSK